MNRQEVIRVLKSMNTQSQRNEPSKTLYQGNLQDNSDTYFRPNHLYSLQSVPEAPPALYRETGTTTEVDKRMFFIPQPVAPTSAAQESLNLYFANRRVEEFAKGQQRLAVGDILSKQAEQKSEALIRDELDRRINIRSAVLNATGMTPSQVQEELVREGLASATQSQTVFDARNQQVQNAVGDYFNRMGGEVMPATLPSTNPIAATVPSNIAATVGSTTLPPEPEETEEMAEDEPPALEPAGPPRPETRTVRSVGTRDELAQDIIDSQIHYTGLDSQGNQRTTYTGKRGQRTMRAKSVLVSYGLAFLNAAVMSGSRMDTYEPTPNDTTVGSGK